MQIESVLQTINRSEPAKNRFSVALVCKVLPGISLDFLWLSPSGAALFDTTDSSHDISSAELCVASSVKYTKTHM